MDLRGHRLATSRSRPPAVPNYMSAEDVRAFCYFFYEQALNPQAFRERFQLFAESLIHDNYDEIAEQHQTYFFEMQEYLELEQQSFEIEQAHFQGAGRESESEILENDDKDTALQEDEVSKLSQETANINLEHRGKTEEEPHTSLLDTDAFKPNPRPESGMSRVRARGPNMWKLQKLPKPKPMVPEDKQKDIGKMSEAYDDFDHEDEDNKKDG